LTFLRREKIVKQSNFYIALHLLTPYSLFYAYFPYQRFLLFGFFFFPFPLISKTNLPARTALVHRKRKRMYHKTIHFVKHLFLFFILFFKFFLLNRTNLIT